MGEIGRTLWLNGEKAEGLQLQEEALRRCRLQPGIRDPRTQPLMHWLAVAYGEAGRGEEARQLDEENLTLSLQVFGPKHPQTLRARNAAASHLTNDTQRIEALNGIIADSTEVLGPEHPYTLAILAQKAAALRDTGDTAGALSLSENVFQRMEKRHTLRHADTLWVMGSLASLLDATGAGGRALQLREDAARVSSEVLGPEHYNTLNAKARLANSYEEVPRLDDAIRLREEILPLLEKVRGLSHPDTTLVRYQLMKNYQSAKRLEDIVRLRRGMLAASEEKSGPDSITTVQMRHSLAYDIKMAGRPEDGIRYSQETLQLARQLPPTPDNLLLQRYSLHCTSWHLETSGHPEEAARLDAERLALAPQLGPVRSTLIPEDATWKWFHPCDGQDPETTTPGFSTQFPRLDFNDHPWTTSPMSGDGFGYGDKFTGTDIGTPPAPHRHTAYFRHSFQTTAPLTHLELRARRRDAVIVYLDGKRLGSDNLPDAPDTWTLPALQGDNDPEAALTMAWPIPSLPAGPHLLAISLHSIAGNTPALQLGHVTLVELDAPR